MDHQGVATALEGTLVGILVATALPEAAMGLLEAQVVGDGDVVVVDRLVVVMGEGDLRAVDT